MNYIFIENYLQLAHEQRVSFFNFIEKAKEFKAIQQEIIFEEEAIMLKLDTDVDINQSKNIIQSFFEKNNIKNIFVDIVKKQTTKFDKIILTFVNTNKHILV